MRGLRTQESNKFVRYFEFVQSEAKALNCTFYLDAGDGRDIITDDYEGEDLMGWLIPNEITNLFEKEWNNWNVSYDWSNYYCWAIWHLCPSFYITFER